MANFIFQVVKLSATGTRTTLSWNQSQILPHSKRTLFWANSIHMTKSASNQTAKHAETKLDCIPFPCNPTGLQYVQARLWLIQRTLMPRQTSHVYSYMCPSSGLSWDGLRPWVLFSFSNQNCSSLTQLCIYDFYCGNVSLQLGGGVICAALPWQTGGH